MRFKKWKALLAISTASILAIAGCSGDSGRVESETGGETVESEEVKERQFAEIGKEAPLFELQSLDGQLYRLEDFRGKPVLLNFYSKDCRFCIDKFPDLNRLYNENKDWAEIMAINVGEPAGYSEKIRDDYGLDFPMLLDEDIETSIDYMVRSIPFTVFIDRQGVVTMMRVGPVEYEDMLEELESLKNQ